MDLTHVLADLGRRYGLDGLALDGRGRAILLLDGERPLILDHRPDAGALYMRLGLLPRAAEPERLPELLQRLLEANLLGEATLGAVWSIDQGEERIELHRRLVLDATADGTALGRALEQLYGTALSYARELDLELATDLPEWAEPAPG